MVVHPSQLTADLHLEAVANGSVFIRDGIANQNIDAVNASTGGPQWTFPTGEPIEDAAYAGGTLYVGSGDHYTYAVNPTTGAQKWSHRYASGSAFIAVAGGVVYTYALQNVTAAKASNGRLIWTRTLAAGYSAPPTISNGSAFFTDGFELTALSTTTNGAMQWSDAGATPGNFSLVGANGVLYCADQSGNVIAYDAASGHTLWSTTLQGGVKAGPIVAGGCVLLATTQTGRNQLLSYCT